MLYSILLGLMSFTGTTVAACSRELLQETADKYVYLQATGDHSLFDNLSYDLIYTENNKSSSILSGLPAWGLTIAHNFSILDTENCATFTELIVTDPKHPYVIGAQMHLDDEGNVARIDQLVTQAGDWLFNATGYLYYTMQESWAPIPESQRSSRALLKAAADAYMDRFQNVNITVPFGTPCARLEGGAYTGTNNMAGNTCNLGLPSHTPLDDKRYVIDEVMGTVDVFLGFRGLDRSQPNNDAPDSHLFRVENGKIRYIHTISVCAQAGCGLTNGTYVPLEPPRRSRMFRA